MKKLLFLALPIALLVLGSCKKDKTPDPNVNFTATISGASEVPSNASAATATATGVFNTNTKILTVTTTFSGLTPVAGHIHKGAVGANGSVIFPFASPLTSPVVFTSAALDATQEADLMAGSYYINLHTAAFPGGEIRGQLVK